MATTINTGGYAKARTSSRSPCKPEPEECPTCGGLECLCRPRFFAGQLLTEENLNQLNQYIIKKNQLHNRYLHGTGVVCGLEVSCDPCDNRRVQVSDGYALSPCGNDIVVCADDSVDICDLIRDCRSKEPRDCRPYAKPVNDCAGVEETWLLAICYEETNSRGMTALRATAKDKNCSDTLPRGAPPQCEPTQVCEGYRYRLFKMPKEEKITFNDDGIGSHLGSRKSKGPFYDRLMCCMEPLMDLMERDETGSNSQSAERCCEIKSALREIIIQHGSGNCELLKRLECIQCEQQFTPNDTGASSGITESAQLQLFIIWLQLLIDCMCKALMPPCPEPSFDDCVPLAAVTVSGEKCNIKKVCTWTKYREYVITMPTLKYWLSIFTRGRGLGSILEKFCCDTKGVMDAFDPCTMRDIGSDEQGRKISIEEIKAKANFFLQGKGGDQDFMKIGQSAFNRPDGIQSMVGLLQGFSKSPDDKGQAMLSEVERNNPGETLLMNMLMKPFVKSFIPDNSTITNGSKKAVNTTKDKGGHVSPSKTDLSNLQAEIMEMRQVMDSQSSEIMTLRSMIKGTGKGAK